MKKNWILNKINQYLKYKKNKMNLKIYEREISVNKISLENNNKEIMKNNLVDN